MKIVRYILNKKIVVLSLLLLSITGFSQNFTVSLANGANPTSTTFEVDVLLTVNAPAAGIRLSSVAFGVNYNPAILNGGTPCTTINCGSWAYIGGRSAAILALNPTNNTNRATPVGHLRATMTNLTGLLSIDVTPGTYTIGRYRFTNTVPFTANSNANLWLQPNNSMPLGSTNTIVSFYPFGLSTPLVAYTTILPALGAGLTLGNTVTAPLSLSLNACATSGTFTSTPVTCFGDNNGTATITLSPNSSTTAITYTVDGGISTPATLVANAFTISGLTAGPHTIVVTGSGACTTPITIPGVVVGGPAQLTNTTSITTCDSYTWPVTGLTYTTSGTPTGTTLNGSGCTINETLNLTINNSTTGTTTTSACDTYTWAAPLGNGVTYTTSQTGITHVSTNAAGCPNTQTLNLTINNSTAGTTNATACTSYTWAAPLGNGVTYTTNQTGIIHISTNASGCPNTQTLNLTINATSGTTTATACDNYTWAAPLGDGATYTTSQTGITHVSINGAGCPNTQTLNLTINNSTTGTTTASVCDTYTWAAPLGNGVTYTTSQTGITHVSTNAAGCPNTQTLNLIINTSTTATTTVAACDNYTWALPVGNGQTYTSSVFGVVKTSVNAAGCTHTQILNLTINNSTSATTNAIACNSYTWALPVGNGITYTSSVFGVTKITTNAGGCPDIQTLNLVINTPTSGTTNATACGTYTWEAPLGNGLTYSTNQTGITHTSLNASGCTHTQTLNLTINSSSSGTTTATACNLYTWFGPLGNNQTYSTSQSGITHVTTNAAGCPHTQTLNLTINTSTTGTTTATACNSYTWALPLGNGQTYTSSVFGATNVTTNAAGCTHTQTLNLLINNNTAATTTASACNTYTWALPLGNGQTYTTSQTGIINVTTNAAGCTNTQTLNLTINSSTTGTTNATVCTTYTWALPLGNGLTYTSSVSGITNTSTNAAGCSHVETLNLIINNNTTNGSVTTTAVNSYTWAANLVTYTTSGTYTHITTNAGGCTNTATLNLTIVSVIGTIWYQDADGDGFGNPAVFVTAIIAPAGYVAIGTDCDDTKPAVNPAAVEICYDGIDNDCNGVIDNVGLPGGCIAIVTSLTTASCGITISNLTTKIRANYVVGAQGYRFRIKNLTTNVVLIKDRPVNFFTFASLPGVNLNATYKVDIALLINNVWQPYYGAPCNVTITSPISTIGAQCGTTLISINQWVYATYFSSASGYRFRVTNTVTNTVQIKDQVLNRFKFSQLSNVTASTIYFVEVALRNTDGTYLPYGSGCNITTPGGIRESGDDISNEFAVITYPNPFVVDFSFDVRTNSENSFQIRIYDMLGKQMENRNVELSDVENLQIGANYPSGVYNVIVSQGDKIKTLRVIKR